jgi:hypothetical protein
MKEIIARRAGTRGVTAEAKSTRRPMVIPSEAFLLDELPNATYIASIDVDTSTWGATRFVSHSPAADPRAGLGPGN